MTSPPTPPPPPPPPPPKRLHLHPKSHYPRAFDSRLPKNHPTRKRAGREFFKNSALNFLVLQILFLALFSYVFGSLFQQTSHTHNLTILFVDYDRDLNNNSKIGNAVRQAYTSLQGDAFPSLVEHTPSEFETQHDLLESVCRTDYWASLYITKGASSRLGDALVGANSSQGYYNRSDAIGYIWNEARYPTTVDSAIQASILLLSNTARIIYTSNLTSLSSPSSPSSLNLSVLANPWILSQQNIQPTTQGSRAIYNSIVIILLLIQEFFYLGTINGLYGQFKLYSRSTPLRIVLLRNLNSLAYTFIGSLCVTAAIFAFRSGWNIHGVQFVLSWMSFWLFAHANFLTLDVFTIWVPAPWVPLALIAWIVTNVTSVLLPFELSAGWYKLGYALPAHEVYQTLTDIWSGGCNPQLRYCLPVLFAWEIVGLAASSLGVYRRCHFAVLGEEKAGREFEARVDAALAALMRNKGDGTIRSRRGSRATTVKSRAEDAGTVRGTGRGRASVATGTEYDEEKETWDERGRSKDIGTDSVDNGLRSKTESIDGREEEDAGSAADEDLEAAADQDRDQDSEVVREELVEIIERANTRQRRERERLESEMSFGPAFRLPFSRGSSSRDSDIDSNRNSEDKV